MAGIRPTIPIDSRESHDDNYRALLNGGGIGGVQLVGINGDHHGGLGLGRNPVGWTLHSGWLVFVVHYARLNPQSLRV